MGINCCKETQKEDPNVLAKGEQEIDFAEYTSSNDKLVQKIEQNYNLLTHLQLYYYLNHLDTFSIETATLKKWIQRNSKQNFHQRENLINLLQLMNSKVS